MPLVDAVIIAASQSMIHALDGILTFFKVNKEDREKLRQKFLTASAGSNNYTFMVWSTINRTLTEFDRNNLHSWWINIKKNNDDDAKGNSSSMDQHVYLEKHIKKCRARVQQIFSHCGPSLTIVLACFDLLSDMMKLKRPEFCLGINDVDLSITMQKNENGKTIEYKCSMADYLFQLVHNNETFNNEDLKSIHIFLNNYITFPRVLTAYHTGNMSSPPP